MRRWFVHPVVAAMTTLTLAPLARGQVYGPADRAQPGDVMIQEYLRIEAERIESKFLEGVKTAEDWMRIRPRLREEYLYMLGLWPMPEKTPLQATITGSFAGAGFAVEMLHYQSQPRLYVTANLYRPTEVKPGQRLPAVLYVCGHSGRGRNGNKTAFQSHGIWFARHGYICLIVDTLQLGEIGAVHHGTYREERWWWHSRGYTPAGVECWNGIRGIDYLVGRPDVDPQRIAVTGISGGGAATFWVAAADERVAVSIPISGMADLRSYVSHRVINGHCDCMFLYNTFRWPWTQIAALIAPRHMLFVNSDADAIFPMDANERIINRLERVYSLFGAGERVDSLVSIGGHDYRKDIRQAAYQFVNARLANNPQPVSDSEIDLVVDRRIDGTHPIAPEKLRVFRADADLPKDECNTTIDQHFVPKAASGQLRRNEGDGWKTQLATELRRVCFGYFPADLPPARRLGRRTPTDVQFETEPSIQIDVSWKGPAATDVQRDRARLLSGQVKRLLLVVRNADEAECSPPWLATVEKPADLVGFINPRGIGCSRWTQKNPPNYVERSHALLGRTVDAGRVWDIISVVRHERMQGTPQISLVLAGRGAAGVLAAYAALLERSVDSAILVDPPDSHMGKDAPQFLNVLRVCDIPDVLAMLGSRATVTKGP